MFTPFNFHPVECFGLSHSTGGFSFLFHWGVNLHGSLNYRGKVRRRYPLYGIIFRWTCNHALTALYAEGLVNPFFSVFGGKDSLYWAAPNAGVASSGAFL